MLPSIALCAVASLGLTYGSTAGTMDWGVETIGGIMVILQVTLIILLIPGLAAGMISAERETGGWPLLQMTPLSTGRIVRGKLLSVTWTVSLILLATLPGYFVMISIEPSLTRRIVYVLVCLLLMAVFAVIFSVAVGSLFRRAADSAERAPVGDPGCCGGSGEPTLVPRRIGRQDRFVPAKSAVRQADLFVDLAEHIEACNMSMG